MLWSAEGDADYPLSAKHFEYFLDAMTTTVIKNHAALYLSQVSQFIKRQSIFYWFYYHIDSSLFWDPIPWWCLSMLMVLRMQTVNGSPARRWLMSRSFRFFS